MKSKKDWIRIPARLIKKHLDELLEIDQRTLETLKNDPRLTVQRLAYHFEEKAALEQHYLRHYEELDLYEKQARERGYEIIAGIDEAGRGPLAGPVVAAAVVLKEDGVILGLDDSKKLSAVKREELFKEINLRARGIGIGVVDEKRIDRINILEATREAMVKAVNNLNLVPDLLLIDALEIDMKIDQFSIVRGDSLSNSIAAASIIAKVTRDHLMENYHYRYPQYGFNAHKGYGTRKHYEALEAFGPTPIHRKTFIKNVQGGGSD
jgi:ribonuclease HII